MRVFKYVVVLFVFLIMLAIVNALGEGVGATFALLTLASVAVYVFLKPRP